MVRNTEKNKRVKLSANHVPKADRDCKYKATIGFILHKDEQSKNHELWLDTLYE